MIPVKTLINLSCSKESRRFFEPEKAVFPFLFNRLPPLRL